MASPSGQEVRFEEYRRKSWPVGKESLEALDRQGRQVRQGQDDPAPQAHTLWFLDRRVWEEVYFK